MKRILLLLGVLVALVASLGNPAVAANAAPAKTKRLQTLDQQVLAALNNVRAGHGLRPLVMSDDLQDAAVFHSRAMLEQGFFAHDAPSGAPFVARIRGFYRSVGYTNWLVGENLLYNTQAVTAKIAIAAWLASPGHRENMLMPKWREVGIGSLHASAAGGVFTGEPTWVITMDFGARSSKAAARKLALSPAAKTASNSTPRNAGSKSKATPEKSVKRVSAKPVRKKDSAAKPVDRVLPRPSRDPSSADDTAAGGASDEEIAALDGNRLFRS